MTLEIVETRGTNFYFKCCNEAFFSRAGFLFSYAFVSYAFECDFAQAGREINRKTKGKHAAEMAAYEARIGAFKFEFYPGRDKPKEEKQSMRK